MGTYWHALTVCCHALFLCANVQRQSETYYVCTYTIVFTKNKLVHIFKTLTMKTFMKQLLKHLQSTNPLHLIITYTQWPLNWLQLVKGRISVCRQPELFQVGIKCWKCYTSIPLHADLTLLHNSCCFFFSGTSTHRTWGS